MYSYTFLRSDLFMMSFRIRRDCGKNSSPAFAARQVLSAGEARWVAAQLGNAAASAAAGGSPPEALAAPLAVACGAAAAALALQCSAGSPDSVSLRRCYISVALVGASLPAVTGVAWEAHAPWMDVNHGSPEPSGIDARGQAPVRSRSAFLVRTWPRMLCVQLLIIPGTPSSGVGAAANSNCRGLGTAPAALLERPGALYPAWITHTSTGGLILFQWNRVPAEVETQAAAARKLARFCAEGL